MSYTITSTSSSVTLNDPSSISIGVVKKVENYVFADGTDRQLDRGKNSNYITISGVETNNAQGKTNTLNNIMDNQEDVTVTGLPDSNLNSDYLIRSLEFRHMPGTINIYRYTISLERLHDNI